MKPKSASDTYYTYHGWFCLLLSELSWNCERNVKDYYFSHSSSMLSNQILDSTMYNVHTYISKVMGLFNRGVTRIKKAQKLEVSTFNFVIYKWMPIFKWSQNLAKKAMLIDQSFVDFDKNENSRQYIIYY